MTRHVKQTTSSMVAARTENSRTYFFNGYMQKWGLPHGMWPLLTLHFINVDWLESQLVTVAAMTAHTATYLLYLW